MKVVGAYKGILASKFLVEVSSMTKTNFWTFFSEFLTLLVNSSDFRP